MLLIGQLSTPVAPNLAMSSSAVCIDRHLFHLNDYRVRQHLTLRSLTRCQIAPGRLFF
jgi:hypothetical protein